MAFRPVLRIGGAAGWYYANWLWRLRGYLDRIVGGPGMRYPRRDPEALLPDDAVDCWLVEAIEPGRILRLRAIMKLPGSASLQFEVEESPSETGIRQSILRQTATFEASGIAGWLYWYALYPVHELIFAGMLRGIGAEVARHQKKAVSVEIPPPPA